MLGLLKKRNEEERTGQAGKPIVRFPYHSFPRAFTASKISPHFGHFMRSKSIRTISAGVIEYPHSVHVVFRDASTFALRR